MTLYYNKAPFRLILIIQFLAGLATLCVFTFLFYSNIILGIWTFAGPMLGLAMVSSSLTKTVITKITHNKTTDKFEVLRTNIFRSKKLLIDHSTFHVELKAINPGKFSFPSKIRLVIYNSNDELCELKSDILTFNNDKIIEAYSKIKWLKR